MHVQSRHNPASIPHWILLLSTLQNSCVLPGSSEHHELILHVNHHCPSLTSVQLPGRSGTARESRSSFLCQGTSPRASGLKSTAETFLGSEPVPISGQCVALVKSGAPVFHLSGGQLGDGDGVSGHRECHPGGLPVLGATLAVSVMPEHCGEVY